MRKIDIRLPLHSLLDIMNGMFVPFGLKNAYSEFQNIVNDIATPFISNVYIDDVLIIYKSIDQHYWKHLNTFVQIIKHNGLVLSPAKINLF
jgi:hypothetical protein